MRADKFFANHYGSRSKAKDALLNGKISLNGKQLAPDSEVTGSECFEFQKDDSFVSRGGEKLERAILAFGEKIQGVYADLGASTGGFTDCLLRHGASKVYCVDVGENQLDERLRQDPRVVVMDNTNARYLKRTNFAEPLDGIVSDLSFISLRLILPAVSELLDANKKALLLFKPQFECGKGKVGKNGILPVRFHKEHLKEFYLFACALGLYPHAIVNAPLHSGKNVEYIVSISKEPPAIDAETFLRRAADFYENRSAQ